MVSHVYTSVNHHADNRPTYGAPAGGPPRLRLTNDFVFKRVFGREDTTDILRAFVNAVLLDSGEPAVVELTVKNPELSRQTNWLRTAILDVLAVDETGRRFEIEVQVESEPAFSNRSLYYWARAYADQLEKGTETELTPVLWPTKRPSLRSFSPISSRFTLSSFPSGLPRTHLFGPGCGIFEVREPGRTRK